MDCLVEPSSAYSRGKKNLTNEERHLIFEMLLAKSSSGKLKRGALIEVAAIFSVNVRTIHRIWQRAKSCVANGVAVDVSSNMPRRVGRKRVQIDFTKVFEVPLRRRTNMRSLSKAMNMSTTTLFRRMKEGMIRRHTNALKPNLTDDGKKARLRFCLSMLEPPSIESQPIFKNMYNYVHIDEKRFYLSKESECYYLLPNEEEPLRTCKSKQYIAKVMFLAAVARPRFDANGNEEFSGKIGICPFISKEPAKRSSKNRVAGTLETKAITSVTKELIRSCLIEKVLPAIRAKWPHGNEMETIYVQQDNARPHIHGWDAEFCEAASRDGFNILLSNQPPNSPDMNVLDLGFFRALQSLQHQEAPKNVDELVLAVEKSFEQLSSKNLNSVFLTLQACMIEVMKACGGNNYKLPHMGKEKFMRDGGLPTQLQCNRDVVEMALAQLHDD